VEGELRARKLVAQEDFQSKEQVGSNALHLKGKIQRQRTKDLKKELCMKWSGMVP
jgi:hypothetical protein